MYMENTKSTANRFTGHKFVLNKWETNYTIHRCDWYDAFFRQVFCDIIGNDLKAEVESGSNRLNSDLK